MIFVTLGSQKFQFNRVLFEIDMLVQKNKVSNNIFAQIGYSNYEPKNYKYKRFLNRIEFDEKIEQSEIVIAHGGTGSIIDAIKKEKKVIAIPRLSKYGEHVDDHQVEIVEQFSKAKLIMGIKNTEQLLNAILTVKNLNFNKYKSNTNNIISLIEQFLN